MVNKQVIPISFNVSNQVKFMWKISDSKFSNELNRILALSFGSLLQPIYFQRFISIEVNLLKFASNSFI